LAYAVLGYSVAGYYDWLQIIFSLVVLSGIFMVLFALNDFYDFKLEKERNFISEIIRKGLLTPRAALIFAFLPLFLVAGLWGIESVWSVYLALAFALIGVLYSLPPLRLKRKAGWVYSPVCAGLIFLHSFFISGNLNVSIIILLVLAVLLHLYTEVIHKLEESQAEKFVPEEKRAGYLKYLKLIPVLSVFVSLVGMYFNLVFAVAFLFSLVRAIQASRLGIKTDFYKLHRNILSPAYAPYEFAVFILVGPLGVFV
jgi:4-hydroxybenzoate polyprenyltransferase